jgi:predicted dehydrogenase
LQCREMCRGGALGEIVHVDAVQGYSLSGPFGEILSSDPHHWVHRLPGGLFQNVISHPLYRITDFLDDPEPQIWATWFGQNEKYNFPSELRVMLRGRQVTGNLLFSSRAQPVQRVTRIYGTKSGIEVDLDGQVIRRMWAGKMPGAFSKLEAPARHLAEAFGGLKRNVGRFIRSEIHYFGGMNRLFREFYGSIAQGTPPPIPPAEIRRVTAIMDQIFCKCRDGSCS